MGDLLGRAQRLCERLHKGQMRDDGSEYYLHPGRVVQSLVEAGIDEEEILAATYLHDTIEDCNVTPDELMDLIYNRAVVDLVVWLTNPPEKELVHEDLLRRAKTMPLEAIAIKMADRLDNLISCQAIWGKSRQRKYAQKTLEFLDSLIINKGFYHAEFINALSTLANDLRSQAQFILNKE